MIHFVVPAAQQGGILEYLDYWGRDLQGCMRALPYEELVWSPRFEPGTYVLAALDQLGPAMLRFVTSLHQRLGVEEGFRFLNDPRATLRRLPLLSALHQAGLNRFRAIPAGGDLSTLKYPVFLRVERRHDGPLSPLLDSPRQVEAAIGRAVLRGHRARDLIVVEFCSTAEPDVGYRKMSAYAVGERIVPRSVFRGPDWMLKNDRGLHTAEAVADELEYVRRFPHGAELREIFSLARVAYGRIDYGILDGRIQTWEINLNPIIGRGRRPTNLDIPRNLERIRFRTKAVFYRSFRAAWKSVDTVSPGRPVVPSDLDAAIVEGARAERQGRPTPRGPLARLLEPARPTLERVGRVAFPFVGRLARRARERV